MKGVLCIGGELDGKYHFLEEVGNGGAYLPPVLTGVDRSRGINIDGRMPMKITYRLIQIADGNQVLQVYVSTDHPLAVESPIAYILERYQQWVDMTQRLIRFREQEKIK